MAFDCSQHLDSGSLLEELNLKEGVHVFEPASASFNETLKVHVGAQGPINGYLITVPTADRAYPIQDFVLVIELLTTTGNINVGVFSDDKMRFLVSRPVEGPPRRIKLQIPFFSATGKIGPLIISKGTRHNQEASVEIIRASIRSLTRNVNFLEYAKGFEVPPAPPQ
jgi:hypothetical protein